MNVRNVDTNGRNEYLKILDMAWQEHLKSRESDAPTVISLFAGAGGSSLGYSMAGYRELLAIEWDNNAVETFKLNFPDIPVYHGDIAKLSVEECLQLANIKPGQLDVLDGSPPCQGFSTAGKRILDDPRNQLFREYIRLLHGLRPKVFVMENVSGMVKGKMKLIFAEIMRELKASGYKVRCKKLNTMWFNVPQSRERLIFIGIRNDLNIKIDYPKTNNKLYSTKDAFYGLLDYQDREIKSFLLEYAKIHPRNTWSTIDSIYQNIKGNSAGAFSTKWLSWNKYSGTLPKSEIGSTGVIHPNRSRYINLDEAKRLHSYPDDFIFTDRKSGYERIGNSVPPLFMKAIAEQIKADLTGGGPVLLEPVIQE